MLNRAVFFVPGRNDIHAGIRKTTRLDTVMMTTCATLMRINSIWLREANPQQLPRTPKSQNDCTGMHENQLAAPKAMPEMTFRASTILHSRRTCEPVKKRRYCRRRATLMRVTDMG